MPRKKSSKTYPFPRMPDNHHPRRNPASVFGLLLFFVVLPFFAFSQGITAPDEVCIGSEFELSVQAPGAQTLEWNLCGNQWEAPPTVSELAAAPNLATPTDICLVEAPNGDYFAFTVNSSDFQNQQFLSRHAFGPSLANAPANSVINLPGLPQNILLREFEIRRDASGEWFGFLTGGDGNKVYRLDFGNSPQNTPVVADSVDFNPISGQLVHAHGIDLVEDNGTWRAFVTFSNTGQVARLDFPNGLGAAPVVTPLNAITNPQDGPQTVLALPYGIDIFQEAGNWYGFIPNLQDHAVVRIEFGPDLTNPSPLGYPSFLDSVLRSPKEAVAFPDCRYGTIVITSCVPEGSIAEGGYAVLAFEDGLNAPPTGVVNYGPIPGADIPFGLSPVFFAGPGQLQCLATGRDTDNLLRLDFSGGCSGITPTPPPTTASFTAQYNEPGNYGISVYVDRDLPTEAVYCHPLAVVDEIAVEILGPTALCPQEVASLGVNPANEQLYNYAWQRNGQGLPTNSSSLSAANEGEYIVAVTDPENPLCSGADTLQITRRSLPAAEILTEDSLSCANTPLTLEAGPVSPQQFSYSWLRHGNLVAGESNQQLDATESGNYQVVITDTANCADTSAVHPVNLLAEPAAAISAPSDTVCEGSAVQVSATNALAGNEYALQGPSTTDFQPDPDFFITGAGEYRLIQRWQALPACADTSEPLQFTAAPAPPDPLPALLAFCVEETGPLRLQVAPALAQPRWEDADGNELARGRHRFSITEAGEYVFRFVSAANCSVADTFVARERCTGKLLIPTAFSPNGDDINDLYEIKVDNLDEFRFEVYDRWGNAVYTADALPARWDGKNGSGNTLPEGTYVFRLRIKRPTGQVQERSGTIQLIR